MFILFFAVGPSRTKSSGVLEAEQGRRCFYEPGTISSKSDQRRYRQDVPECLQVLSLEYIVVTGSLCCFLGAKT